ncbi:MAG: DUF1641 domain-containing protein [Phycisphaerales bacterium]|nr:DUF1641 domain-containing protein [Phycisphaerales bacterium]
MIQSGDAAQSNRVSDLLTDTQNAENLQEFFQRLPELNGMIGILSAFVANGPQLAENANGIVETARESFEGGGDIHTNVERFKATATHGVKIAEELSPALADPETIKAINKLIEALPMLTDVIEMVEMFMANSSLLADNVNSIVETARESVEKVMPEHQDRQDLLGLPGQIIDIISSPALKGLLNSQVIAEGALLVMDQVATATIEAHATSVQKDTRVTRFGAIKAMGDPDVQRGMAFAFEFARCLGKKVHEQSVESSSSEESSNGA